MSPSEHTPEGLAYEIRGSGPPLLLIHAGIADRRMWKPQWQSWGERFTLIRYDQRGFGRSDDPLPGARWSLHEDALAVLAHAGFEAAAVLGCSFGARTAIDLALESPASVKALVAVGAIPSGSPSSPELDLLFEEVDEALETEGFEAANELELRMWMDGTRPAGSCAAEARELIGRINRRLLERQGELFEQVELAVPEPPAAERLDQLTMPVLALAGAFDQRSVVAGAHAIAAATGGEAVEIAGAAHLPSLERPAEFERAVLPFLGERAG